MGGITFGAALVLLKLVMRSYGVIGYKTKAKKL